MRFLNQISVCAVIGLLFLSLLTISCQEEIDLGDIVEDQTPRIVVYGFLTNQPGSHKVQITESRTYTDTYTDPEPVTGASVSISDGTETFVLQESDPGNYLTDSTVHGEVGKTYTIRIEINGTRYTAADRMIAVSDFEPVTFAPSAGSFNATCWQYLKHRFGTETPNMWRLEYLLPDSLKDRFPDFPAVELPYYTHPAIETSGLLIFESIDNKCLPPGTIFRHRKFSLSDAHYAYLKAVFSETDWRGGIFDAAPADPSGNFDGEVLGFFGACAVKELVYPVPQM